MSRAYITIHANSTSAKLMAGIRCATANISLPGHDGVPLEGDYSLPRLRAFLIRQVSDAECVLIGNSLGGMLAHQIADRVNVRGIISVGIPPLNYRVLDGFFLPNACNAIAAKPEPTDAEIRELCAACVPCEAKRAILESCFRQSNPWVRQGLLQSILAGELRDERAILGALDIPMLFIRCERDCIVNNDRFDGLGFGEVRSVDAGHLFPFEDPEGFNRIVEAFLAEHGL